MHKRIRNYFIVNDALGSQWHCFGRKDTRPQKGMNSFAVERDYSPRPASCNAFYSLAMIDGCPGRECNWQGASVDDDERIFTLAVRSFNYRLNIL